jgi:chromosome segregation ATPase
MVDDVMTKEELLKIEKDIAEAKAAISTKSSDIKDAKEEGKKEAEKEFKLQQELESHKKAKEELEKQLIDHKKSSEEQAKKFQEQLDALKTTKMPVNTENPFAKPAPLGVKQLTREQIDAIEEASRREFFEQRGPGSR